MGAEKTSITLTIRGRSYSLRTEACNQRLEQVVDFVNSRLDELVAQPGYKDGVGVTDLKLMMLALLNVADECLTNQSCIDEIQSRSESLRGEVEQLLEVEQNELSSSAIEFSEVV